MSVSERELVEALRPLRPDPEAFRRAVAGKLARRRAESGSKPQTSARRWAASVLPVDLLGPTATASSVPLGKPAIAALSMPAVSLAVVGLTFAASLRALLGLRPSESATRERADRALREWWREHALAAAIAVVLLVVVGRAQPVEGVLLVLSISMLALTSSLLRLARAGAASSASVGSITAGFLTALTVLTLVAGGFGAGLERERWANPWVPIALLAGSLVCEAVGGWRTASRARKLFAWLLPLALLGLGAARLHAVARPVDRARLAAFVERFDAPLADVVGWMRFGTVARWLAESGAARVESPRARARIEEVLAGLAPDESVLDADAPAHALLGAAEAELLPERVFSALRSAREAGILAHDGPLLESATTEWLVRAAARGDLDDGERTRLATRLVAAWPDPDAPRALEAMASIDDLCALLGRPLGGESLRGAAHHALESHWVGTSVPEAEAAGFVTDPARTRNPEADVHGVAPTLAAVRLMRRFGVPAKIELERVEAFLRRAATPSLVEALAPTAFDALTVQSYRFVAEVGLGQLELLRAERSFTARPRRALERLSGQRLLLAALALVGLALFATGRTAFLERRRRPS